jgi:hypothetical protein
MHWYLAIIVNPSRILEPPEPPALQPDPPRTRSSIAIREPSPELGMREESAAAADSAEEDYVGPRPPEIRVVSTDRKDDTTSRFFVNSETTTTEREIMEDEAAAAAAEDVSRVRNRLLEKERVVADFCFYHS